MGRRESTMLLFWGLMLFWGGLAAACATGIWMTYDVLQVDWQPGPISNSFSLRIILGERLILLACCHMVSLLGGITYRLSQAS